MRTPNRFYSRMFILLTVGLLSLITLFGCSDNSKDDKPVASIAPTPKVAPIDQYEKASNNFDAYDYVDYN